MSASATRTAGQQVQLSIMEGLANSRMCSGLGRAEIAALAERAQLRSYRPFSEAVAEGQSAGCVEIVLRGRFIALLPGDQLDAIGGVAMIDLKTFIPGDCFGEHNLVQPRAAAVSVVAAETSHTVCIDAASLAELLEKHATVGQQVYRNLFQIRLQDGASHPTAGRAVSRPELAD